MPGYSDPLALSAVETESLRMLRARLNKPAASDAAKAVLGKVFLETVARVGLKVEAAAGRETLPFSAALIAGVVGADMGELKDLCASLAHLRATDPRAFARLLDAKVPQSIISRRLALAGREPSKSGD